MTTKHYLPLYLMAATALTLNAGPARRQVVTLTQPSGATIEATFCGDEFGSYYMDRMGQHLRRDSAGYWTPMTAHQMADFERRVAQLRSARAADNNMLATMSVGTRAAETRAKNNLTLGDHKMLTLLIQFSDLEFSEESTVEHFEELLNGTDYSYQGATGSAQRYYRDQSQERFTPTFDVVGPVTLTKSYSYYGGNSSDGSESHARDAIIEGLKLAVSQGLITDLKQYDNDGDGYVDLVFVFYAGYSEADCGIEDYIWPHQWAIPTKSTVNVGGTRAYKYACASELQGSPKDATKEVAGIGTCVHEFSHGLGLPDFYNTGDSTGCYGMDKWSVMDQGCYNNDSRTPPNFTAYERHSLGWLDYTELPTEGDITLPRLSTDNVAYAYINPNNSNEAFIFENHQSEGWDAYYDYGKVALHGMLITHVDYNASVWSNNEVNNSPTHQRYTLVPADGRLYSYDQLPDLTQLSQTKFVKQFRGDIWPGTSSATEFSPVTNPAAIFFTGDSVPFSISKIAETEAGDITMHVSPYPEVATVPEDTTTSAIDRICGDELTAGRYVDLYDMSGRRVVSGVSRYSVATLPLSAGYYVVRDGASTRKIFIK